MAFLPESSVRNREDLLRVETEMTLEQRLPERSILGVFIAAADRHAERTAITMVMTGAADEQARRVSYPELLGLVRRAANLFATLGRSRPRGGLHAAAPCRNPCDAVGRRDRRLCRQRYPKVSRGFATPPWPERRDLMRTYQRDTTLGLADARIEVKEGGRRGMRIDVTLPRASRLSIPVVEQTLAAYLFGSHVATAQGD
jgi:hypothetical protein